MSKKKSERKLKGAQEDTFENHIKDIRLEAEVRHKKDPANFFSPDEAEERARKIWGKIIDSSDARKIEK